MYFSKVAIAAALSSVASAASIRGFNYGATHTDGSPMTQSDYNALFSAARNLPNANGFSSARLYTMIQAGTQNTPISAIPAAIAQDTTLLLGLWASAGQANIDNEIAALRNAINLYGPAFTSRVVGISVGSEDLYRDGAIGRQVMAGIGAGPSTVVNYIQQVRQALQGTSLSGAKITHVDTYNAWTNGTNAAVINAVDFISIDTYPYFQFQMANQVENGKSLFQTAYLEVAAVSAGKEIWVTETGWPVSGPNQGAAIASTANAKRFWDDVGCGLLFGQVNTYWYTLQDASPQTPSPSFGIVGAGSPSQQPLFDLTCSVTPSNINAVGVAQAQASSSTTSAAVVAQTTLPSSTTQVRTTPTTVTSSLGGARASIQPIGDLTTAVRNNTASSTRPSSSSRANATAGTGAVAPVATSRSTNATSGVQPASSSAAASTSRLPSTSDATQVVSSLFAGLLAMAMVTFA